MQMTSNHIEVPDRFYGDYRKTIRLLKDSLIKYIIKQRGFFMRINKQIC